MNIGLLTYHWVPNFGANLQALATVSYLRSAGHNVSVLNYRPEDLEDDYVRRVPPAQIDMHNAFAKTFLPESRLCRTEADLARAARELQCNAIIVGSDAVLRVLPQSRRTYATYPNPFWLQ